MWNFWRSIFRKLPPLNDWTVAIAAILAAIYLAVSMLFW
jgi:hypothetical protein